MRLGGTGKTQLAAAFAGTVWASGVLDLLVWLDAGSHDSIVNGYARALADVRVAAPPGKPEAAASRFLTWLADTGRRWLVVLDGLTDPADAEGLWPQGPSGQALVTTEMAGLTPRPAVPAPVNAERLSIAVASFSRREAMEYLSGRLDHDSYQASGSLDLAIGMDLLPAALSLAVSYLADSGENCGRYRLAYEKYRRSRADGMAGDPLAPAWMLALDRARQFSPTELAWPALKLAAVLGPGWIPAAVLTSSAACAYLAGREVVTRGDPADVQAAFGNLQRLGLVTIEPDDDVRTLRMPAALRSSVRRAMGAAELRQAVRVAADALCEAWPADGSQEAMEQTLRDGATGLRRCDDLTLWDPGCHPLMVRTGRSLENAQMAETALAHWRDLAGRSAAYYGARSPLTLQFRASTAAAAATAGHADEAVGLGKELAADIDEMAGPAHPEAIASRATLARLLRAAGRFSEAISLGTRLVAECERLLSPAHAQTTQSMHELGSAYGDAGHHHEAIGMLLHCLALREQGNGLMHPVTLATRNRLAAEYRHAGRENEALMLYQGTLVQIRNAVGTGHPDTVTAREHLAMAHYHAGQADEAATAFEQAIAEWRAVPGNGPVDTIAARANLAAIHCLAGRLKQAISLYESELADLTRIHGPGHPDALRTRRNLAAAYHKAKRVPEAIELGEATLADCERALGSGHTETLTARANLAHAYHAAGRLKRASAHFDRALRDCELTLGQDDPVTDAVRRLRKNYLAGRQGTAPIVAPPGPYPAASAPVG